MSNSKKNSRRNKRRNVPNVAVNVRAERSDRASLGSGLAATAKKLFAWENVQTWHEVRWHVIVGAVTIIPLIAWAFWPTVVEMVHAWNVEPDYSHGFLIPPIALYFLWARKDRYTGWSRGPMWAGLATLAFGLALRWVGAKYFLGSVDGWALVICIAGATWAVCGTRVFWFALPSIAYLLVAVPLPFRIERVLSLKLQGIATKLSTWTLQLLGQPALAEGHTILLGDTQLEVAQACSGMRIFLGIFAVAFAYIVVVKRAWWETLIITAAIIPIALIANATRIVTTGLLYQFVSGEAAKHFSHDLAGWVMIPWAAVMFALMLWYMKLVYREVDLFDNKRLVNAAKD